MPSGPGVGLAQGTFDVLMVDNKDPWDPCEAVRERMRTALAEAHRVLAPKGCLLSITFAGPHFRRPLLLARPPPSACFAPVAACPPLALCVPRTGPRGQPRGLEFSCALAPQDGPFTWRVASDTFGDAADGQEPECGSGWCGYSPKHCLPPGRMENGVCGIEIHGVELVSQVLLLLYAAQGPQTGR